MHTLAVYGASSRGEAALREIASLIRARGTRLTVVSIVHRVRKGRHAADALVDAARARRADEIVLADPRASRLGILERRRSPVPVTAAVTSPV